MKDLASLVKAGRCAGTNPITGHRCVYTEGHDGRHAAALFWGETDDTTTPAFVPVKEDA